MRENFAFAILFVAIVLSGCAGDKPSTPGPTVSVSNSESATASSSLTTTSEPPTPTLPQLILNNCTGWTAVRNYPGATAPGPRPTGWGTAPETYALTGITIKGYRCNRIAVGPFERGPIQLLYEFHSNASVPEACQKELAGLTEVGVLANFAVDDPELASFLRMEFGMPAALATIQSSETEAGPGTVQMWSWRVEGGEESTLVLPESGDASASGGLPERLFWEASGLLHRADFVHNNLGPKVPAVATGTVQPPFYAASNTAGAYTGFGTYYASREAVAEFRSYGDLQCAVPN